MNTRDASQTVLLFNDCINDRDVEGLSRLMTEDHTFIDRENTVVKGKKTMTAGWAGFFAEFPEYKNTFTHVQSRGDTVVILGYAEWSKGGERDHVIWKAKIRDDRVAEWRIYEDTEDNRAALGVSVADR